MAARAPAITRRGSNRAVRASALLYIAFAMASSATHARADGAFADSKAILLSRADSKRIYASSDVAGLLVSDDGGASWFWICESAIGFYASLFQLGPASDEALYAITQTGLASSNDRGCSWQRANGVAQSAGDVFPDPADPARVLIVAQSHQSSDDSVLSDVVAESNDRGQTFGAALFTTDSASITGVEIARSDPSSMYLTMSTIVQQRPYIVRSGDAGKSWTPIDLSPQLGRKPATMRIVAVDPSDANTVYLRVSDGARDTLAITHDGGATIALALQLDSTMSAFLLRSDGALIVASKSADASISTDGGRTFATWPVPFHVLALAERDGAIYASADSRRDGFAFAVSRDLGDHWRALLRLDQLRGPLACGTLPKQCGAEWQQLKPQLSALTGTFPSDAGIEPVPAVHDAGGCLIATAAARSERSAQLAWLGVLAAISCRLIMRPRSRRSKGDRSDQRTKETRP